MSARPLKFGCETAIHGRMSSARVTCVVTTYQYGHFIGRRLDSVLAQDHPRDQLEVVVVDDGSTDNTREIVARYDEAVRYVHQPNAGQIAATNRGIAAATGDYITLVDADDTVPRNCVSARAAILDARPEVGLVYGDMEIIDAEGALVDPSYHRCYDVPTDVGRVLGPLLERNFVPGGDDDVPRRRPRRLPPDRRACVRPGLVDRRERRGRRGARVRQPADGQLSPARRQRQPWRGRRAQRPPARQRPEVPSLDAAPPRPLGGRRGRRGTRVDRLSEPELVHAAGTLGLPAEQLAPVSPADAHCGRLHLARGRIARARGDRELAVRALVLAAVADPLSAVAGAELVELLQGVPAPGEPLDARRFVTLAVADELLADAALLRAYASVFDARDDATLLIYAPQADDATGGQLAEPTSRTGLDGPDSPDMLAIFGAHDSARVMRTVHATLSERSVRVPGVACWGSQAVGSLRQYVQACLQP